MGTLKMSKSGIDNTNIYYKAHNDFEETIDNILKTQKVCEISYSFSAGVDEAPKYRIMFKSYGKIEGDS